MTPPPSTSRISSAPASTRSCSATSTSIGIDAMWQAFEDNGADAGRFERNLRRFVRGIEMDLAG